MSTSTTDTTESTNPTAMSMPRLLLHAEGLVVFIAAILLYARYTEGTWWLFVLLLFTPDISMLPYMINPRWGAIGYNVVHTYVTPLLLAGASIWAGWSLGLILALILLAHIGMDRTVSYGLKYTTDFKQTHFNHV